MKRYCVLGLGQTGMSVVRYLCRQRELCDVFDDNISGAALTAFQTEFPQVPLYTPENIEQILAIIPKARALIISPGISFEHPIAKKAHQHNIPIIGDIELFAQHNKAPVVAITGTNGKSTVTTLVGEMAKAAGLQVCVGGNIGEPVLNFSDEKILDWVILELSSFQLESTHLLNPVIACILNITPDHMDRYPTMDAYIAAKQRIYHQADNLIICVDDQHTWPMNEVDADLADNIDCFGLSAPEDTHKKLALWGIKNIDEERYLAYAGQEILHVDDLKIKGTHNWSNALAALAIGHRMGLSQEIMCDVLRQFPGLEHRCQWVREIKQVNWYNDSKGTNVGATLSAIHGLGDAIPGKIVLLLGGQSKGADFADLCAPIQQHVRAVIVYGQDADRIETMLKSVKNTVPIVHLNINHAEQFHQVIQAAQKAAQPGDIVLLSPACASWDMFDNFMHRGKVFTEQVQALCP